VARVGERFGEEVTPKALSPGEEAFALHCKAEGLNPFREYVFSPPRKWRFDFAFPGRKLAVEIEGGLFTAGRHVRGAAVEKDFEKYNAAAKDGWRVLRYSTAMVKRGDAINDVLEILALK
jgi:very-short-patch-repair endonuclease